MKQFKKFISIFFRVGISIVLLYFLFEHLDLDAKSLIKIISNVDKPSLALAFLVFSSSYIMCIFRWNMLLKGADIHLSLKRILISFSGGIFFSLFMPSTIGGDMIRSIDLATHTKKPKEVLATVFLDRVSGYVGLVLVVIIAVLFGWQYVQDKSTLVSLGIIIGILVALLLVLFSRKANVVINRVLEPSASPGRKKGLAFVGKIKELIKNLHHEIHIFRERKGILIKNVALSFFIQLTAPLAFYIIALAIGIKINILFFFIFIPIIGAITLLPISIGGLGLRDAAMVFFFAKAGVGKDAAMAMSLLNFLFIVVCASIGGLIYVFTVRHRRLQHHPSSAV